MKTALCFTPDLAFFRPAVFTAASLISQGDADAFDIFIVCEPGDVAPGFERLEPALRDKIRLVTVDFARWAKLPIPDECSHLRRWHAEVSARPSAKA